MTRETISREKIILAISDNVNYSSLIAKKIDMTYIHVVNVINQLVSEGILKKLPRVKIKIIIVLTEKGKRIKAAYIKLNEAYSS